MPCNSTKLRSAYETFLLPMRNWSQTLGKSQKWPVSSDVSWVTLGFSFQRGTHRQHIGRQITPHFRLWLVETRMTCKAHRACGGMSITPVVTEQSLGNRVSTSTLIPWWKWYESKNWWKVQYSNWSDVEIIFINRSIYTEYLNLYTVLL